MSEPRAAIVIGGGLVGLWSTWYLLREGWNVTVLERQAIGSGASHGNCGYVCPSHVMPLSGPGVIRNTLPSLLKPSGALSIPLRFDPALWNWLFRFSRQCNAPRMAQAAIGRHALLSSSMSLYRDFVKAEAIECQWQDEGLLLVFRSSAHFDHYAATANRLRDEFGVRVTPYEREAVRDLEPTLRAGMAGGWHYPDDAHLRPDLLLGELRRVVEQRGGVIREHVDVQSIRREGSRVVGLETSAGSLAADLFVLATGAETPRFAKSLGCRIPIQPGKGFSFTTARLANQPKIPMIFEEQHVAVTPLADAFRVGSTMQFTGYDRSLDRKRLGLLRRSAEQHLSEPLPTEVQENWSGWRPMVYDGLPCIDRAPAASNLIVAAGNGMIGLASSPATGKLVAEIASHHTPHLDPIPYSLARFR